MALDLTNLYVVDDKLKKRRNYHDFLSLDIHPVSRDGRIDSDPLLPSFPAPRLHLPSSSSTSASSSAHSPPFTCNYFAVPDYHYGTSDDASSYTSETRKAAKVNPRSIPPSSSSASTTGTKTVPFTAIPPSDPQNTSSSSSSSLSSSATSQTESKRIRKNENDTVTLSSSSASSSSLSSSSTALPSTTTTKSSVIPTHLTATRSSLPPSRAPTAPSGSVVRAAYSTVLNNMITSETATTTDNKSSVSKSSSTAPPNFTSVTDNHKPGNNHYTSIVIGSDTSSLSSITNVSSTLSRPKISPSHSSSSSRTQHGTDGSLNVDTRNVHPSHPASDSSHRKSSASSPGEISYYSDDNNEMEGIPILDPDADEQEIQTLETADGVTLLLNNTLAMPESTYREFRRKTPSNRIALSRDSHFGQRDEIWLNEIRRRAAILAETPMWIEKQKQIKASLDKGRGNINLRGVYHPKPNQVAQKWRCCYYLDYHQEYLGAYTSVLEAAVAYDYAVSYMRPHDIGVINGVGNRVGGKIIDINFPGTVSDCRVEPPIDPWPLHVQETENIMAIAAAEQNANGTAAAVAAILQNATSVVDLTHGAEEIHVIRARKDGTSLDVPVNGTTVTKKLTRIAAVKVIPGKRLIDLIDENDDQETEETNNIEVDDDEDTTEYVSHAHDTTENNPGGNDENMDNDEDTEPFTETVPVVMHGSSSSSSLISPHRSPKTHPPKRNRGRPPTHSARVGEGNVNATGLPTIVRSLTELLPIPPSYVPLPLVDLNDDTTVDFDEPVEAWLTAEKAIEPLPPENTYLYEAPVRQPPPEPEEPYGGLVGPEPEQG